MHWFSVLRIVWLALIVGLLVVAVTWRFGRGHRLAAVRESAKLASQDVSGAARYYEAAMRIVNSIPPPVDGRPRATPKATPTHAKRALEAQTERRFFIDEAAEKYPTLADFTNTTEGTYVGVKWSLFSPSKPRVLLLSNLLSPEERRSIIDVANRSMRRSETVHAPGTSGINDVRTSYGMFITGADENLPANRKLRERVAAFAGCKVGNIESTQVLRYYPGQFYRMHPDYFSTGATEHLSRGGQRFATVLTWLNDVQAGGYTAFPLAKKRIPPQPGMGVFFYSMDKEGHIDTFSQHEAEPVEGGMKWVAVTWIRQHTFN